MRDTANNASSDYDVRITCTTNGTTGQGTIRMGCGVFDKTPQVAVYGSNSSDLTIATNDSPTKITLNTAKLSSNNSQLFELSNGGIKIKKAGCYRITASVHMGVASSDTNVYGCNAFIYQAKHKDASTNTFENAVEIAAAAEQKAKISQSIQVSLQTTTIIKSSYSYDVFYLAARSIGGSSIIYRNNDMTYLSIEYLGS